MLENVMYVRDRGARDRIATTDSALHIYKQLHDTCGMVRAYVAKGNSYDNLGYADSSLAFLIWAQEHITSDCDSTLYYEMWVNLTSAYLSLSENTRIDSLCKPILSGKWTNPKFNNLRFGMMNNWAIAKAYDGKNHEADSIFRVMHKMAVTHNEPGRVEEALNNIGTLHQMNGNLDSAYYYINLALFSMERRGDKKAMIEVQLNMAAIQANRGLYTEALQLYVRADSAAIAMDDLDSQTIIAKNRAGVYQAIGNFELAYQYLATFRVLNDSLMDREKIKAVTEMQEKYESEKKQRAIQELKVQNLDSELRYEKIKRGRNRLYAGAGGLLIVLFFLVQRYRIVHRNRNELQAKNIVIAREQKRSDDLLKNILPDEVAEELKEYGKAKAQHFDMVTIMFTDFKNFTIASEVLTPQELVNEINMCYSEFDRIITEMGIEKIKTIGDAYMCAGGLPVENITHAEDVVEASLHLQEYMHAYKTDRISQSQPYFELRLGIHTGPVVAGIVGIKKFRYDIWGDAVNTASRMESSGEVGRVNISEATYELVKHLPQYTFEHRGKVKAKNKGEMDMYFVSRTN